MACFQQEKRLLAYVLVLLSTSIYTTQGFAPLKVASTSSSTWKTTHQQSTLETVHKSSCLFPLYATKDDEMSFSKRRESPLGVRRRVRAVLEKARTRTGIRNNCVDEDDEDDDGNGHLSSSTTTAQNQQTQKQKEQSAPNVVAGAASIGGLGGVLNEETGSVEVALYFNDTQTGTNGKTQVRDPASTTSPFVKQNQYPEDSLIVKKPLSVKLNGNAEVEAIKADVPAAYTEPLPFTLPKLSADQCRRLSAGERIQEQSKMGRDGSGYVVIDIKAPPYVVWECLLDFESYPQTIPTVRDVRFFSSEHLKSGYHSEKPIDPSTGRELRHYGTPSTTRAAFILSKFRLNIAAIHNYRPHPDGHYMVFTLDPECTNYVLRSAKGIWYTETNPDGRGEVSSV